MTFRQVDVLSQMVDAVNAGDAHGYASLYSPGAVITIHGSCELRGRAAIEQYEVELLRQFPGARLAFCAVWLSGHSAVVHYAVNGRTPGGSAMGHEGLLFYRFDPSGLIAEERRYMDSMTPMAQLGLLGGEAARPPAALPIDMQIYVAQDSPREQANVATVRATLAALDSRNESAFLSAFAEHASLDELICEQPFVGKRNVEKWLATWTRALPDASTEITSILGIGQDVLVESLVRGTLCGPLGRLLPSNTSVTVHRAFIVHVTDGGITRLCAFMNGKELAESSGQWTSPPTSRTRA